LALVTALDGRLENLPRNHPNFATLGLTNPARIQAYTTTLLQSDLLVTHSRQLETELRTQGFTTCYIPEAWFDSGGRWQKPVRPRCTLNLGWIGSPDEIEAVTQIRGAVLQTMRDFPHLQLIIAGDDRAYSLFDALPASRRIYLPSTAPEDLPFVFGMMDLLLIPLQDTPYHRALSDLRVMQAGLRGVPWLASPVPAYREWGAGGLCVPTLLDWRPMLRSLVIDAELRAELGQQGRQRALERHAGQVARAWLEVFKQSVQIAARRRRLSP
jgi:glycosyltransferase involved in cell wall biosynthesis